MKVLTVVGARPQFIKSAPVSRAFAKAGIEEYLVHTGQHYDKGMSSIFFDELCINKPDLNLGIGSGSQAQQVGKMLISLEKVMQVQSPDAVVVYGDTNSTLAGALSARKLNLPVAHIEAGLRSFNQNMPEETNRILTDHCSSWLFCPTENAVGQLKKEGLIKGVHLVGDPMYDAILLFGEASVKRKNILEELEITPGNFYLATIHRVYNTDQKNVLWDIFEALSQLDKPVIFPIHPRTNKMLKQYKIIPRGGIRLIPPVGYLEMLVLEKHSRMILTDSGGIQKEAFFLQIPCITLRTETEWVETVATGWNKVVGTEPAEILEAARSNNWPQVPPPQLFGDGSASLQIATILNNSFPI